MDVPSLAPPAPDFIYRNGTLLHSGTRTRLRLSTNLNLLLQILITRAGRVVTHEAIRQHLDPVVQWGESNVRVEICRLRRRLCDAFPIPNADKLIRRQYGQGYMWTASVRIEAETLVIPPLIVGRLKRFLLDPRDRSEGEELHLALFSV